MSKSSLNLAGRMARMFVTSKLTVLFILATSILGLLAVLLTPREENPQIIVPGAQVRVVMPGASSAEVEELIINPLESLICEIPGVDHIYSTAMNSIGVVMVVFEVGEDKEESLVKLYDKILGNSYRLPPDASPPVIVSADVDDVPVVTVTLASETYDDYALKRLADRMVERLHSLEDVSTTMIIGGRDREIRVELDPERLQAFGVTLDQIQAMLSAGNLAGPMGDMAGNNLKYTVYLDGFLASEGEVGGLIVGQHRGRPIYLEDVARIIDAPPVERETVSRFAFGPADPRFGSTHDYEIPAVTIGVAKKMGTNAVFVADDILDRVERMKSQFVPADVHVVVTRNDGQKANDTVNMLIEHLGIAIAAVFIIIALFLGFKDAVIVGISVPLILSITLGADLLFGPTINRITLFGLLLCLGMLVDAAIVVIENINRHYKTLGDGNKIRAAVLAVNEIGNPTNLATLAVMLVFISMFILTGTPHLYFFPIAFNVPVAMAASLIVAYIVTPWAAVLWLKPQKGHGSAGKGSEGRLHRAYLKVIIPLLDKPKRRRWMEIGTLVVLACAIMQPLWQFVRPQGVNGEVSLLGVPLVLLPKDNKNTFYITVDMPENTPVEVTDRAAREVGEMLRGNRFVTNYQVYSGSTGVIDFNSFMRGTGNKSGSHLAEVRVNLIHKHDRSTSCIEIASDVRTAVLPIQSRYPGCVIRVVEDMPGPPVRAGLLAEIYGPDLEVIEQFSDKVEAEFQDTYGVIEIYDSKVEDVRQLRVVVDKQKAALSGVATAQVAQALHRLIAGEEVGRVHIEGEKNPVPIKFHVPRRFKNDPDLFSRIFLTNRQNQPVPLSELIRIVPSWEDHPILHKDKERVTYVNAELKGTAPVYAVLDLDERLDGLKLEDGTQLTTGNLGILESTPDVIDGFKMFWHGEIRMTINVFRDMGAAMLLSLAAIYLLLIAYYRSFIIPLIAMAAIPLGLIGVFPGHWIMGQPFTATSMIGLIALAGVVVRNSLLIIDFVLHYLEQGLPLREAVRAVRFRPILLTALAIVLGVAILLKDPSFGGLAISLIFGTLSSTVLTMVVVPVLTYLFFRDKGIEGRQGDSAASVLEQE